MLQKLVLLFCVLCCTTASSSRTKVANFSEIQDLDSPNLKAGTGFLIIAIFMLMGDYSVGFNEFDGRRSEPGGECRI